MQQTASRVYPCPLTMPNSSTLWHCLIGTLHIHEAEGMMLTAVISDAC